MSDDEVALEMTMPLDSDGFLRRECPTCIREFKWLHTPQEEGNAAPVADGGYFCPYCGVQAEAGTWLTQAQADLAQNLLATKVVGPMLEKLGNSFKSVGRSSGGMFQLTPRFRNCHRAGPTGQSDYVLTSDLRHHRQTFGLRDSPAGEIADAPARDKRRSAKTKKFLLQTPASSDHLWAARHS
jgi:hypothetical protein